MGEDSTVSVSRRSVAREQLRECCAGQCRAESIPTGDADGRVLAETVRAKRPVPHYDRVQTDGYAVRARETFDAGQRSPVSLSPASSLTAAATTVRVDAGDVVPDNANAVVPGPQTDRRDDTLLVFDAVAPGENVSLNGSDISAGQVLFEADHRLRPADLAVLGASGVETVSVTQRPSVNLLPTAATGIQPDTGPTASETRQMLISTLVDRWGGESTCPDTHADRPPVTRQPPDADILVLTGGQVTDDNASVRELLSEHGELCVDGVAMSPGGATGFGRLDETLVFVFPSDPVSVLVGATQFLRPAIAWRSGLTPPDHPVLVGQLTGKVRSTPREVTFARVTVERTEDRTAVEPISSGGSGLDGLAGTDGWVEIPASSEGLPAGVSVEVQQWAQW